MKKWNLVSACLVVMIGAVSVGCSSDPGDDVATAENPVTPSQTSDSDKAVSNSAKGTGTWVFVNDRECRSDCTDRSCSCTGPICPGAPEAGLPCTFLGSRLCLVKRSANLASVFYCESN